MRSHGDRLVEQKVKSGVPGYGLWGGSARKDAGTNLVPAGTPCTVVN